MLSLYFATFCLSHILTVLIYLIPVSNVDIGSLFQVSHSHSLLCVINHSKSNEINLPCQGYLQ